ncbi:transcriptional regulator family: Fungal Specific TF [Trichoderma aggressivum f. europaeum]|uniref:Transcriptional regulator family: Fungal Specific TF n=1 Tax=Trichoderma aggressivum f. europaeum TaxID=173218 RepID=A0AAE1M5Z4_9HYPO|nr:transcriptional regulator family: Fungal Specific TF [Trichoderma aggressivum f. europaeum]
MSTADPAVQPLALQPPAKPKKPLSCISCKVRKLKCDHQRPACSRCVRIEAECIYPEARRKPTLQRNNVKELEARLAQVEGYLKQAGQSSLDVGKSNLRVDPDSEDVSKYQHSDTETVGDDEETGLDEQITPPDDLLTQNDPFSRDETADRTTQESRLSYETTGVDDQNSTNKYKDEGEHFITIRHAQAWALITCYEARAMLYTRASMSAARCCRLVQMMALDKLDISNDNGPATLVPPIDWTELEERRRVFWVAFSIDAQGSIATGWPNLIHAEDIMTRLPASEEAFASGQEEQTPYLDEALKGAPYGGFSASLILNHILTAIMSHVHLIKPSDHPEDIMNGTFWKRHRRLDNQLSCLFMFMPDRFRLPENLRDPLATYINLNFHASVICLHHVALETIEKNQLDDSLRKDSLCLLKNAAEEIVSIVKMTSHRSSLFSNPLCAFSLYCATTVYVYLAKQDPSSEINPADMSSLELIINAMEAMGRIHMITCAFLQQACLDIDNNGLSGRIKLPILYQYRNLFGGPASNIPLLARSPISRHTQMSSPLPGRLPLDKPLGQRRPMHLRMTKSVPLLTGVTASMSRMGITDSFRPALGAISRNLTPQSTDNAHKRKRQYSNSQSSSSRVSGSVGTYAANRRTEDGESTGHNAMYSYMATMGQQQETVVRPQDPMIDGDFMAPGQTDSPSFSYISLGQPVGSVLDSGDSNTFPGAGQGTFSDHNEADFQHYQTDTPLRSWQPMDNEVLTFSETMSFPTDTNLSGNPLDFFNNDFT